MKPFNVSCLAALAFCLSACSSLYEPTYFGSQYTPTTSVQVFYAARDVKQPYEVMGHMNAPTSEFENIREKAKQLVLERAKKAGADAVIFSEINRQTNRKTSDDLSLKVEVIKYTAK